MGDNAAVYALFLSCGAGFLLGAYYDVFRIWRFFFRSGRITVFWQDILFFSSAALATFLFFLAVSGGVVRIYMAAGLVVGFVAYRLTLGRITIRIVRLIAWAVSGLWRLFSAPFRWLAARLRPRMRKIGNFVQKIARKGRDFFKKLLKPLRQVLYNQAKSFQDETDGPTRRSKPPK